MSWFECFALLAAGAVPLLTLEAIKASRFYRSPLKAGGAALPAGETYGSGRC